MSYFFVNLEIWLTSGAFLTSFFKTLVAFKMERLARKDPGVAPLPDNRI